MRATYDGFYEFEGDITVEVRGTDVIAVNNAAGATRTFQGFPDNETAYQFVLVGDFSLEPEWPEWPNLRILSDGQFES